MQQGIDYIFPFGRHIGILVSSIKKTNPEYLKWVLKNCKDIPSKLVEAIEYHLTH